MCLIPPFFNLNPLAIQLILEPISHLSCMLCLCAYDYRIEQEDDDSGV